MNEQAAPTFEAPSSSGSAPAEVPPFERTEVQIGAAFAGGVVIAMILKRLGN